MSLPPDPHDDDLAIPPAPPAPPSPPAGEARPVPERPASPGPAAAPVVTAPAPAATPAAIATPAAAAAAASADAIRVPASGATDAAGGGRQRLGVMVAAVLAVTVIAGGIALATGEDGDSAAPADTPSGAPAADDSPTDSPSGASAADTPVEAAEAFFAAVTSGDCAGIVARMTPESYGAEGQTAEQAATECENDTVGTAIAGAARYDDIELVFEGGDQASIRVTVTTGGEASEHELPLRRVDGGWLMHLDTSLVAPAG